MENNEKSYMSNTNNTNTKDEQEEIFTSDEVARMFRTSQQTIRRWIALGTIDPEGCFQVGKRGRWRIRKSALEKAKVFSNGGFDPKWFNTFPLKSF